LRIISRSTLRDFWRDHRDAEQALRAWHAEAEKATWQGPADIRARYGTADFLPGDRVVFDIKGNRYRLVVAVKYAPVFCVYIRFVGTHAEYDHIDATTV
jgi:mRNA interferase HigB